MHRSSTVYEYPKLLTERVEKENDRANKRRSRGESMYGYPRLLFEQESPPQRTSTAGSSFGISRLGLEEPAEDAGSKEAEQGPQRGSSRVTFVESEGDRKGPTPESATTHSSKKLPSVGEKEDRRPSVYPTELFKEAEADLEDKRRRSSMPGYPRLLFDEEDEGESVERRGAMSKSPIEFPVAESCASEEGIEQFLKQEDNDDDNSVLSRLTSRRAGDGSQKDPSETRRSRFFSASLRGASCPDTAHGAAIQASVWLPCPNFFLCICPRAPVELLETVATDVLRVRTRKRGHWFWVASQLGEAGAIAEEGTRPSEHLRTDRGGGTLVVSTRVVVAAWQSLQVFLPGGGKILESLSSQ